MAMAIYNAVTGGSAESRGISVHFPSGAAENAIKAAKKYGANLENHVSKQLTAEDIEKFDLIITMTGVQKKMLLSVINSDKIVTLAQFAGENGDVADPFGGDEVLYEETAAMIYDYINKGLNKCIFAKEEDAEAIANIEKENFSDSWSINSINTQIGLKQVIVYKENTEIFGYCIFMTAADEGEILRICVDKERRNQGTGSKLISCAVNIMKNRGASEIFLEVRASNENAIALYEKTGFIKTGIRKKYYDNVEDAILYNLKIKDR